MTEWRALSSPELVELVRRLRALEWSWRLAEAAQVANDFGWVVDSVDDDEVVLDIGFGADSGRILGDDDGAATEIELRVTDYTSDDADGRARAREFFAEMTAAASAELGPPTRRIPGVTPQVRWTGPVATTVLRDLGVAVVVRLVINAELVQEDRIDELDQQGLL